jgi:hypothetical protein
MAEVYQPLLVPHRIDRRTRDCAQRRRNIGPAESLKSLLLFEGFIGTGCVRPNSERVERQICS